MGLGVSSVRTVRPHLRHWKLIGPTLPSLFHWWSPLLGQLFGHLTQTLVSRIAQE